MNLHDVQVLLLYIEALEGRNAGRNRGEDKSSLRDLSAKITTETVWKAYVTNTVDLKPRYATLESLKRQINTNIPLQPTIRRAAEAARRWSYHRRRSIRRG